MTDDLQDEPADGAFEKDFEQEDAFFDAALREALSGPQSKDRPPDLRGPILRALGREPKHRASEQTVAQRDALTHANHASRAHRPHWGWMAAAGALLIVLLLPLASIYLGQNPKNANIAEAPTSLKPQDAPNNSPNNSIAQTPTPRAEPPEPQPAPHVEMPNFGPGPTSPSLIARAAKTPPTYRPLPEKEILAQLRSSLQGSWTAANIKPSPDATDAEWCRRTFLALLGRVPTVTELDTFTKDKSASKRDALVTALLYQSSYVDESSHRMASLWTNALIGRVGGEAPERVASRAGLVDYLTKAFQGNRPFDTIVKELLTATGSTDPAAPDYNGAVNFLLDGYSPKATLATARTSRLFLGKQLQCVQCHDHPTADTKQNQFWGLNAFFRQMTVEQKEGGKPSLVNHDFRGESPAGEPAISDDAEIYYEQKNGQLKVAFPTFLDGQQGPRSGLASVVDRRAALADWIVQQEEMPLAVVNRVWSQLLGFGFSQPIDDLGPHNPASNPELLNQLSEQFVAHRFDLKALTRWIVLSDAFSRSSRLTADNVADVPEQGARPLFSRYYTRQMDPESLFDSLHIAASLRSDASALRTQRAQWLGQFMSDMKTDEADEHSTYNGGIPQSLTMMNGEAMMEAVSLAQGSTLRTVIASDMPLPKKIEHLYLAALSRPPSAKELENATKMVTTAPGGQQTGLADLWWALLNSGEFILDH